MEFTQTSLGGEYSLIQQQRFDSYAEYEATFITDEGEYPVMTVISIEWIRDYRNASADEVQISVGIEWGKYLNKILPFKENLKMLVTKRIIDRNGIERAVPSMEQMFIAHLPQEEETDTMGNRPETASEKVSDLLWIKKVSVQLEEEAFSRTRSEMVGGVFRDSRPFDIMIALLNNSIKNMDLDKENSIKGISAVPPNNMQKRSHTVIPHGVPLVAVANKLQKQFGGIYNCGIGCYLQKGFWYVWPLYNYKLYDTAEKTALFILPPSTRYRGIEYTYRENGTNFVVMITGGYSRIDPSEGKLLNEGNGTRFANTDVMMESFVNVKGNKATAFRNNNANEYEAVPRKGAKMNRVTDDMAQSNPFNEASKIAERNAAYVIMNWENSNPDLIFPGLQAEVAFIANGDEHFINGVVVHAHVYSALAGKGIHQKAHQTTTQVVVMIDRLSPSYKAFIDSQQNE